MANKINITTGPELVTPSILATTTAGVTVTNTGTGGMLFTDSNANTIEFNTTGKIHLKATTYIATLGTGFWQPHTTIANYSCLQIGPQYMYGTSTSAATVDLTGEITPDQTSCVVRFTAELVAQSTGGTQTYGATILGTFKNVSGTLTLIGTSTEKDAQRSDANISAVWVVVTNRARLRVTGLAATNIRWEGYITGSYGKPF